MRYFSCLVMLALVTGCSTVKTEKSGTTPIKASGRLALRIPNDSEDLEANIGRRISALGFTVVQAGGDPPDYYADVAYGTAWDVYHQTFSGFRIVIVDAKTREELIRSRYVGRFGFNGVNGTLDSVFKDLARKLKNEKAPRMVAPARSGS